jgi:hypothetical protein
MEPVEDFDALELSKTVERRDPRLEDFDAAEWPVRPTLPRRFQARGPRGVDATDEHQPNIRRGRHLHRYFSFPYLVLADHSDRPLDDLLSERRRGDPDPRHVS